MENFCVHLWLVFGFLVLESMEQYCEVWFFNCFWRVSLQPWRKTVDRKTEQSSTPEAEERGSGENSTTGRWVKFKTTHCRSVFVVVVVLLWQRGGGMCKWFCLFFVCKGILRGCVYWWGRGIGYRMLLQFISSWLLADVQIICWFWQFIHGCFQIMHPWLFSDNASMAVFR